MGIARSKDAARTFWWPSPSATAIQSCAGAPEPPGASRSPERRRQSSARRKASSGCFPPRPAWIAWSRSAAEVRAETCGDSSSSGEALPQEAAASCSELLGLATWTGVLSCLTSKQVSHSLCLDADPSCNNIFVRS